MFALLFAIRSEECRTHVAFTGLAGGIFTEAAVKGAEVRKIRNIRHQGFDARRECFPSLCSAVRKLFLDSLRNFHEYFDQLCNVAASVVDIGLE